MYCNCSILFHCWRVRELQEVGSSDSTSHQTRTQEVVLVAHAKEVAVAVLAMARQGARVDHRGNGTIYKLNTFAKKSY